MIGAGGGAVVGGIIGAATGNDPRVGALIGAGVGGLSGAMIGKYMDQQEAELRAQLQGTGVSVTRVGQQIILNMPSNITFATDSAMVQPQFNETLVSVGLVLKKFNKTVVDVYGHTDSAGSDFLQPGAEPEARQLRRHHSRQPGRRPAPVPHRGPRRGGSDRFQRHRSRPAAEPPGGDPALAVSGLTLKRRRPFMGRRVSGQCCPSFTGSSPRKRGPRLG